MGETQKSIHDGKLFHRVLKTEKQRYILFLKATLLFATTG